jgi:hypothetical protein
VGSKPVAKGMGCMCAFGSLLTGSPEHIGGDRMTRCLPWVAGYSQSVTLPRTSRQ